MSEFTGEMVTVKGSSNISSIGYDKEHRILRVQYQGEVEFDYLNVPEKKWELLQAEKSKGSYISRHIQSAYEAVRISDGVAKKPAGAVQKQLKELSGATDYKKYAGTPVLYTLWLLASKPITGSGTAKEKLFAATKAILIEAAGSNQVRPEHLPDAIRLAAERNL